MKKSALYLEACFAVLAARLATRMVRFSTIARVMGWRLDSALGTAEPQGQALAAKIGLVVASISRRLRLNDACLAEAVAAKWMLGRRKVTTTLILGFRIKGSAALAPRSARLDHVALHAWLVAGEHAVVGVDSTPVKALSHYR